jgi:hypothetical protein
MKLINVLCASTFFSCINSKHYLRSNDIQFLSKETLERQEDFKHFLLEKQRIKSKERMELARYEELKSLINNSDKQTNTILGLNNGRL